LFTEYRALATDLKSKGEKDSTGKAKLMIAKRYGVAMIDHQFYFWQKCFELAMQSKKHKQEFTIQVLKLLDMYHESGNIPPILITAGFNEKGQPETFKNLSPEIVKLMSTPPEKVEVKLIGNFKTLGKNHAKMVQYIKKSQVVDSNMEIAFVVEGQELYRVGSQLYTNGRAQFKSKAGNKENNYETRATITGFLDGTYSGAEEQKLQRILERTKTKRKRKSVPQKDMDKTFKALNARAKGAIRKIQTYASTEGLDVTKLKPNEAELILFQVSQKKFTPEQAMIEYEHRL
jgi:hypothetical protein